MIPVLAHRTDQRDALVLYEHLLLRRSIFLHPAVQMGPTGTKTTLIDIVYRLACFERNDGLQREQVPSFEVFLVVDVHSLGIDPFPSVAQALGQHLLHL